MKPNFAFLFFFVSSLACFGQSQIVITNLAEQQKLGREFVQELLSLRPETNSSGKGVMKIRDAKGKTTEIALQFNTVVTSNDWRAVYRAKPNTPDQTMLMVINKDNSPNKTVLSDASQTEGSPHVPGLHGNETMIPFSCSDFWLADLGLEFLHWPEQRMIKKEMSRSQFCKVIESINPQPASNAYSKVISWIQHEGGGIVHAEAYDAKGKLLKIFEPKEIEKVNGQWQLREMEMRNVQTRSRTRIEFDLQK